MSKSVSVTMCVCVYVCMNTHLCLNCPYSYTHMNPCAVILEAVTHVRASEFHLKVLPISVPKFGRPVVPVNLPMTLCGQVHILV